MAVSARRRGRYAECAAYDGDLARILLPADAGLVWVRGVADPADDLRMPMKGPLVSEREGPADLHRLALRLTKSARLLPAAVVLAAGRGGGLRAGAGA